MDITIIAANDDLVAKIWIDDAPVEDFNARQRLNARRIVACVNACKGLTTEGLERSQIGTIMYERLEAMREAIRQRDHLQAQVDELLEELTITLGSLKEICSVRQIPRPESTIRRAESVITKITGETK